MSEKLPAKLEDVYFAGTLLKKVDSRIARWHSKYVELSGSSLSFTSSKTKEKKTISVSTACLENGSKPIDKPPHIIVITGTAMGRVFFQADTLDLKNRWAAHIFYATEYSCTPNIPMPMLIERMTQKMNVFQCSNVPILCPSAPAVPPLSMVPGSPGKGGGTGATVPSTEGFTTTRPTYNGEGQFCGIVLKRSDGGIMCNWKPKWFLLIDNVKEPAIEYREPPTDGSAKSKAPKRFSLQEAYLERTEVPNPNLYTFALSGPWGRIHIALESQELQVLWMMMCEDAIAKANPSRPLMRTVSRMRRRSLRSNVPLNVVIEKTYKMESSGEDEEEAAERRAASPDHKVNKSFSGWMWKKGNRTWHKRYVTVKEGVLSYCEESPDNYVGSKHHLKTFVLEGDIVLEYLVDSNKKYPVGIKFGSGGSTTQANTAEDDSAGVILATGSFDERLGFVETLQYNRKLAVSSGGERYEATLMKRGDDALSSWKKKYVTLCGTTLTYAESKGHTTGMKTLPLQKALVVSCEDINGMYPFALTGTFGRVFFAADCPEIRMLWGAVLEDAIATANPERPVTESLKRLRVDKKVYIRKLLAAAQAKNPKSDCLLTKMLQKNNGDNSDESSEADDDEVTGAQPLMTLDEETAALLDATENPCVSGHVDVYHAVGQPGRRLWATLLNGVLCFSKNSAAVDPEIKYPLKNSNIAVLDDLTMQVQVNSSTHTIMRFASKEDRVSWENKIRLAIAIMDPMNPINRAVLEEHVEAEKRMNAKQQHKSVVKQQASTSQPQVRPSDFSDAEDSTSSLSSDAEDETTTKPANHHVEGYFLKKSKPTGQWHRRWVVVDVPTLCFVTFKSHSGDDHKKAVPFGAASIVKAVPPLAEGDVPHVVLIDNSALGDGGGSGGGDAGEGALVYLGTTEEISFQQLIAAVTMLREKCAVKKQAGGK